jgi:hypothetical protein
MVLGGSQPHQVFAGLDLVTQPPPKRFGQVIERAVVAAAHVEEHGAALRAEDRGIFQGGSSTPPARSIYI